MFGKKTPIGAYVLVKETGFGNIRHVSILLEKIPVVGTITKEMDLELSDQDILSIEKLIDQLNDKSSDDGGLNDLIRIHFRSK